MINWYYMVALAGVLIVFLLYKEWTRKKRSLLYARLIASLLAVASLLFMAYPYAAENVAASNKLIILTNGFIKDSVDNFLKINTGSGVYSDQPVTNYTARKVQLVADWSSFSSKHATDTFHVFGNGFGEETLLQLQSHPIVFHSSPALPAISNIYWKQSLEPGEQLTIQGSYENNSSQKIKLLLQAFGAEKDSVSIAAGARQDFQLHTVPVHSGFAVYSLVSIAGKDTLHKEPVPVEVQTITPLQVLIISSSPDFDNTYLKNNLSQHGYQFTVTNAISTNKTNRQFLNMPAQQATARLTTGYLNKFDVLIADRQALQQITAGELSAVRSVVEEKGTGLLIKMDGEKANSFYARFFPIKTLPPYKESFILLRHAGADSSRYKIKITDPVSISYTAGTQAILQDAQSNIYASAVLYGSGKIIATTLQNTYSLALAGNKTSYQQLWWLLLNKAARKINPEEQWNTHPFISFVNQPVQLQVEQNDLAAPVATTDQSSIYLTQHSLLPFVWQAVYWPVSAGWQSLPRIQGQPGAWYVYKAGNWQQLINHQYRIATKNYTAAHAVSFTENIPADHSPVNIRLLLLIVFLGSCIFLWVEQKAG